MADYIANRYLLEDMLGSGGMGAVWRASDRLSGQQVALKRVNVAASRDKSKDTLAYRLALALEFRILASLRHPHIMSVLDYGFDASAQPFYTMTLLENAQPITDYADNITDETELIQLIIDLLEAIAYLHRRDLIHRDLKPQNVLVTPDGEVKVLDFGLALHTRESVSNVYEEGVGTVRYMAPELLTGDSASVQSDLYAIGVIVYQVLAGNYPYNQRNLGVLVQEIMNTPPDTSMLPTRLQRIVDRLLMKQADYRYEQAQAVIDDLAKAMNTSLRVDKRVLRESYLQAARFVGRDEELRRLRVALKNTLAGAGSQWLIGGESGIGKSRLLEELRTLALVEGATVLRGQSVTGGERRFYMWLDILRQLALMVDISDDEASILKTILPNLDTLLQRETPSARSLRGVQGQQLLVRTIVTVLMRYDKPLIILLEDLHWAGNSLDVLQQLSAQAQDLPYLIIGTYRDDERPDLPVHLSDMDVMRLSRLDAMSIEQLSAAMLGMAGKQPHVLKLLREETEGNVFFMVEIVRALAEDAGRLDAIGQQPLPHNILTGGVQRVVQRRLDRLPDTVRMWLNAVAVAGRQLDILVVSELTDDTLDLTSILMLCSNVAVLTVEGDNWRFAHDKIRESIIDALSDADYARYNQQVAEAIEHVYPDDDSRVAILLEHWLAAHVPDKIISYTAAGVHQMLKQGYIEDALAYAERALPYMPEGSFARMDLYTRLGLIYRIMHNMQASQAHYQQALSLARALTHTEGLVKALCGLATVHVEMMNDLTRAQHYVDEALRLSGEDITLQEDALMAAGRVAAAARDFDRAKAHYEASLHIHQQRGNRQRIANTLNQLGLIAMRKGDLATAHAHLSDSIAIVEVVGNYFSTTNQLQNLIDLEGWRGDFEAQKTHAQHVIALWREHNARPQMAEGYFSLAHIEMSRSDYESARNYLEKGTHIVQQTGQTMEAAWFNYGWLARLEESYTEAMLSFSKAFTICTETDKQHAQAHVLCQMGLVAFAEGNHKRAQSYITRSWQLCEHLSDDEIALHIQILCGTLLRDLNQVDKALAIHEQALSQASKGGHIQHRIAAQAALSRTLLASSQASEGRHILQAGLADAWAHQMMPYVLALLLSDVDFMHQEGQNMAAAEQLHMIAQHPAVGYVALENRMDALVLWTHLQQTLSIEAQRTAKEHAMYLDVAKIVYQRLGLASAG